MTSLTGTIGARGTLTLPKQVRDQLGLCEGSLVLVGVEGGAVVIRPAVAVPRDDLEEYTPERRAEFLLNNAVGPADYAWARREVERLGLDPDAIDHNPPN